MLPVVIILLAGLTMKSLLLGSGAFEEALFLTEGGPPSISCPRQFAPRSPVLEMTSALDPSA